MKLKSKTPVIIAVIVLLFVVFWIYLLFFAYIPNVIDLFNETSDVISEETALKECPEVVVTDYDREFLDELLNDSRISELEDSEEYNSLKLTADEAGLERYAPRADENYTAYADYKMYGILPLYTSIQFEYKGGIYQKDLYISASREETGNEYTKAITIKRFDGKSIKSYWYRNGKYIKETQRYGLINHIDVIIDGIMSV
ncbi:MAG: hypothetical protein IJZ72_05255 [Oscillospiraceae bacterium]|nr:hypothetical protein [Oscillospiraceae bacterium]